MESRVVQASENFKDMAGIPGTEMIGRSMEELFPSEFAAKIKADDWAVVSGGNVLYTIDFTERKRAEESLHRSEAKFRAVVENSYDGIIFGDAESKIRYRSPSYQRINGYSDEERLGHFGFETVHADDVEGVRRYWDRARGDGSRQDGSGASVSRRS